MQNWFTVAALAGLTLHVATIGSNPVSASNTACTSSGADGCSCEPFVCDTNDVEMTCRTGKLWQQEYGCTEGNSPDESSYETSEGANATVCTTTGPLVGAGCSSGAATACRIIRSCPTDGFGICEPLREEEGGFFSPCTPNS